MEENKSKGKEERVKDSKLKSDSNLSRHYSKPKANLTTTIPNEEMVEEYLQQAWGMEDEYPEEVFITANCVQKVDVSLFSERVTSFMNSLVIEGHEKLVILDDGADTNVVGHGWEVMATHPFRKAHVIGFDHKVAVKRNLDMLLLVLCWRSMVNPSCFRSMRQFVILLQNILFCLNTSLEILEFK